MVNSFKLDGMHSRVIISLKICACAARVTVVVLCVCVSVCLSVKSHLTSGVSVRPENTVTYSAGNGGQKFVGFSLKLLCCRDPALPPLKAYVQSAICAHAHYFNSVIACAFSRVRTCVALRVLHFSAFILYVIVA